MTTITFRGTTYTVVTATSNDQILNGTSQPDWLEALGGNNQITTGSSNDVILAGVDFSFIANYSPYGGEAIFYSFREDAGNNTVFSGSGNDYVATGTGNDLVYLGSGNDIFDGSGGGNDTIFAGAGNDIIDAGGPGQKIIDAGSGNDSIYLIEFENEPGVSLTIDGGAGDDQMSIVTLADNVVIRAGSGNDIITRLSTGNFDSGTAAKVTVDLGTGNDRVLRLSASELDLSAGTGNDTIIARIIARGSIDTGTGDDDVFVSNLFENDLPSSEINTRSGDDLIGTNVLTGSSTVVFAGSGDDTFFALGDGDTQIWGENGDDIIFAGLGNDTIYDGNGDDIINLRGGVVNLRGDLASRLGASVTVTGGGNDTVYSGNGNDIFILGLGDGVATIYGYAAGEAINLTGLGLSSSDLTLSQSGLDTILSNQDDQLAILKFTQVSQVSFFV